MKDHYTMLRPEDMKPSNMPRPSYNVISSAGGSDLAGSMVAAFAAGSLAFESSGKVFFYHLQSVSVLEFIMTFLLVN